MRLGFTIAHEARWADHVTAMPSLNMLFFSKGALLRALPLDTLKAIETLCSPLHDQELSEPDWFVRFGTEERKPSCPLQ